MRTLKRVSPVLALCGLAALAAGCSGSSNSSASISSTRPVTASPAATTGSGTTGSGTTNSTVGPTTELTAHAVGSLGQILTGENGLTLYEFDKDASKPPASNCNGSCATTWPAATGNPQSLTLYGVTPSLIGSVTRQDGTQQLTYDDHPLYYYFEDTAPGQALGEGISSLWYALAPNGQKALPVSTDDLNIAQSASLGQVMTNQDGFTLYVFAKDTTPGQSSCYGACALKWPPLTVQPGSQITVSGVNQSLVGDIMRTDGTEQVTLAGHPLYTFSGDSASGQTNGQGIDGTWYAVMPDGQPSSTGLSPASSSPGSGSTYGSTSGSGSGY